MPDPAALTGVPQAAASVPPPSTTPNPVFSAQPAPADTPADGAVAAPTNGAEIIVESQNGGGYNILRLLELIAERGASDLHIAAGYPPLMRLDGKLQKMGTPILTPEESQSLVYTVLPDDKKELLEVNKEVDLAYGYEGVGRFRINAYYERGHLAAAFRLIPNKIKTIDELNLPKIMHHFTKLEQGLVLVTGPTGSGKSTSLAAILHQINVSFPKHILTIEDPIEYIHEPAMSLVSQREMHEDSHSWEIALRSALRQDPNVVLVGEMRDKETIAAAITVAETGHLVFATLHTNGASQTMDRIIDVFPPEQQPQVRSQLAVVLQGIMAQRLVPLKGGGRRAVNEVLIATPAVRNLIREGKTHQLDNVIRTGADIGMMSMEASLIDLFRQGMITREQAEQYAPNPEEVARLLGGSN